jgi:hypothetical protein
MTDSKIKNDPANYKTVGMAQAEQAAQLELIRHLAEYTTERNWADKRDYIIQAANRALSASALLPQEGEIGVKTPAERFSAWLNDGPRLAKEAGLYVGIKVSTLKQTEGEGK